MPERIFRTILGSRLTTSAAPSSAIFSMRKPISRHHGRCSDRSGGIAIRTTRIPRTRSPRCLAGALATSERRWHSLDLAQFVVARIEPANRGQIISVQSNNKRRKFSGARARPCARGARPAAECSPRPSTWTRAECQAFTSSGILPSSPSATSSHVRACVVCDLSFAGSSNVAVLSDSRSALISPRVFARFIRSTSMVPEAASVPASMCSLGAGHVDRRRSLRIDGELERLVARGAGVDGARELAEGARSDPSCRHKQPLRVRRRPPGSHDGTLHSPAPDRS